jgi:hypothetical protein
VPAGVKDFVAWTDVVARVPQLLQQIQVRLIAQASSMHFAYAV